MDENLPPDDEIDLLDFLVTVAENIKLLILGPVLAGVLAFGAVSMWPATYESGFTLQGEKKLGPVKEPLEIFTPAKVSQLVTSPAVLADAAKALQSSGQGEWAALLQSGAVTAQVPRNTKHATDPRDEMLVALRGLMALVSFNDDGEVTEVVRFGSEKYGAEYAVGVELPSGSWHTVVALVPDCVLLEVKAGPFDPNLPKDLALWAPEEGSDEAGVYLQYLAKVVEKP